MPYFNYLNKNVFYKEIGSGPPLVFLHGNTASSKMFDSVIDLYNDFKIIAVDFLGHGKSDRLKEFSTDMWFDEAKQVIQLLDNESYKKVNLIGSSGGALVAINVALERPDLVNKVIADSFEGEKALDDFCENIKENRQISKSNKDAVDFYQYNHGNDWESVVDNDTMAIEKHYKTIKEFYHKPIESLSCEVLLTGSKEDEFVPPNFYKTLFNSLTNKIKHSKSHIFKKGGHPAILSNASEFARIAKQFLA